MGKVNTILKEILYEEKDKKSLKLFYKVDIFIQDFISPEQETTEPKTRPGQTQPEPVAPAIPGAIPGAIPPPAGLTASVNYYKDQTLNEDIFKAKGNGEIFVPKSTAENIQTLEDLLDFLSDEEHNIKAGKEEKGNIKKLKNKIIDDLVIEIILAVTGVGQKSIQEIINRGDKLMIDVDYGSSIDNSIGFKVNKRSGSDTLTMIMKKDGKILTGKFDTPTFNKMLIYYRNSLLD